MSAAESHFITWKGRRDGPYSVEQLASLLEKGDIGLLHRVETRSGTIPLRDLLIQTDPVRWGGLANVESNAQDANTAEPAPWDGIVGSKADTIAMELYSRSTAKQPLPPTNEKTEPAIAAPTVEATPPRPLRNNGGFLDWVSDPSEVWRAYTACGMCFLIPPLYIISPLIRKRIIRASSVTFANGIQALAAVLATVGVFFWLLLWMTWKMV